ncbi:MAG: TolC family protein [Muribaculaceae bacterium]|nr:TolC family protein [Muribaculaceae bacterium]
MKKLIFSMLLATASTTVAMAQQDGTLRLTLDDAINIALSENPTIKVADQEITKQEYAKKGTLANLLPSVDFSAAFNRAIKQQVVYMGGDMGGLGSLGSNSSTDGEGSDNKAEASSEAANKGFKMGRTNTWSLGFSGSMPLINAQLWKQLKLSADEVEMAVEKARSSRLSMVSQVRQSFYGVLLAEASHQAIKENYDNAQQKYTDIKQKYEHGLSSEYDLIRAEVAVKNVEPNLLDAENSITLAKWRLKALIGIDLDTDITLADSLENYTDTLYAEYPKVDTTMVAGSSAMRQLDIQGRELLKARDIAKAAYYPTLNLSLSYQWNAMANDFKFKNYMWNPYSVLAVQLNIPLLSFGRRHYSLQQTKVQISQLQLTRIDTERSLMLGVRQYSDKMLTGIKQYDSANEGVSLARKGYDIATKRYDTGAGTLLEVNDSQLALTQAQLSRSQAIYNFLVAKAQLDETMGIDYTPTSENK